jgi:hypothetical protein
MATVPLSPGLRMASSKPRWVMCFMNVREVEFWKITGQKTDKGNYAKSVSHSWLILAFYAIARCRYGHGSRWRRREGWARARVGAQGEISDKETPRLEPWR